MPAMMKVKDVASYFLAKQDTEETGELISNLKIQKLCYYTQGFSLAINNESSGTHLGTQSWSNCMVAADSLSRNHVLRILVAEVSPDSTRLPTHPVERLAKPSKWNVGSQGRLIAKKKALV